MTVVINKTDSKEVMKKKLNKLGRGNTIQKKKSFTELRGTLKNTFKEDAVELQRKWRSEWD